MNMRGVASMADVPGALEQKPVPQVRFLPSVPYESVPTADGSSEPK